MKFSIVTVLYEKKITELPFYNLLEEIFQKGISVLCYDNSQESQKSPINHPLFTYYHDQRNLGLSPAYNLGYKMAKTQGNEGLLLLDHDSQFSMEFIEQLEKSSFKENIGAIVPMVFASGNQISPVKADVYISHGFSSLEAGIHQAPFMAINSGSLLNMQALEKIGGFNEEFPLDFLDHWLFWALGQKKYQLEVLDYVMHHDLSVLDYSKVSHKRYESILTSETTFYKKYNTKFLPAHKKQLLKRTLKQIIKVRDSYFWKRTLNEYRKVGK